MSASRHTGKGTRENNIPAITRCWIGDNERDNDVCMVEFSWEQYTIKGKTENNQILDAYLKFISSAEILHDR